MSLAAGVVAAQSVQRSDLELCAGLDTSELKLACFEAIVEAGKTVEQDEKATDQQTAVADTDNTTPQTATELPAAAVDTPAPPPVAESPAAAADAPAPPPVAESPAVEATTPPPPTKTAPAIVVEQQSTTATPEAAMSSIPAAESEDGSAQGFGQEHLDEPVEKKEEVTIIATVTDVTKGSYDTLYFHLANGHVWRQIEPRYLPYPKKGDFDISITRGMMGDYRMRIGDKGRMVAIRRVE